MSKLAALALIAIAGTTLAAPPPPPLPTTFTVKMEVGGKDVTVAEITRTNGGVSTKTFAVPAIDDLGTKFIADWTAYKHPASVTITEHHPDHTGMHPQYRPHSFTFTPKDALYKAAVVREFLTKGGYKDLGLSLLVKFVVYDRSAEYPPMAHDRASTLSNFRKGDKLDYNGGVYTIWVKKQVHAYRGGGRGRISASDKSRYLATGYDDGTIDIAIMFLYEDGRIEVKPITAAEQFKSGFGTFTTNEDITVRTVGNDEYETWHERKIPKTSRQLLEAHILSTLEYHRGYKVTPVIDPMTLY